MKALTLTVPWAMLPFVPDPQFRKCYETRSWATSYRGTLAIHAALGLNGMTQSELYDLCITDPFCSALVVLGYERTSKLPRGVVLGTVEVVAMHRTDEIRDRLSDVERAFGDYSDGRWAWEFSTPVLYQQPIVARGAHRLWEWAA